MNNWSSKTILIAEDEDINYFLLAEILEPTHARLLWAKTGLQAVSMSRNYNIDLILMDIKMPEMNGIDAARIIRAEQSDLPIIAQTAYAMQSERELILASGCDDCIVKPLRINTLMNAIRIFFQ